MRRITLLVSCVVLMVGVVAAVAYAMNITGTSGPDTLIGTPNPDTISGRGGADTIKGKAGDDELHGGTGSDAIYGQPDNDLVIGGDSSDDLFGNGGRDEIYGSDGNDDISPGQGTDELGDPADPNPPPAVFGGGGNDFINLVDGVAGNDSADCGSGEDDTVRYDQGASANDRFANCENEVAVAAP